MRAALEPAGFAVGGVFWREELVGDRQSFCCRHWPSRFPVEGLSAWIHQPFEIGLVISLRLILFHLRTRAINDGYRLNETTKGN